MFGFQGCRVLSALLAAGLLLGGEHRGVVRLGTGPVPGATVTARQNDKTHSTLTDLQGTYVFADLPDGLWIVRVEMRGFEPVEREVSVPGPAEWSLKILPMTEIAASGTPAEVRTGEAPRAEIRRPSSIAMPAPTNTASGFQRAELSEAGASVAEAEISAEVARRAADGLLVNGSVNNAASSPFRQLPAFGNNRTPGRWRYNGNLGLMLDHSALDARPFSLTGQRTPRPDYSKLTLMAAIGGPIQIPGLVRNGPQFTLTYQRTRNGDVTAQSALMPTQAERSGDLSATATPLGAPVTPLDPETGQPFPGGWIPASRISAQALALLALYPLPNFDAAARYNFQTPVAASLHRDSLQFRVGRQVGRKDNLLGTLQLQSTRTADSSLFGFLSTSRQLASASTVNWRHNFSSVLYVNLGAQFNRDASRNVPYFAGRFNVSGAAGIAGNNQDPLNWGPPALSFAGGTAPLGEAAYASQAGQTKGASVEVFRSHRGHAVTSGAEYRRQQWNLLSQRDARGTFAFTGGVAGSDLAGFLLGLPDTASIAFGNADKYFRANSWAAYVSDDWRFRSGLSLTLGVRYEYDSPIRERYGRLVNLAVSGDFASVEPVIERSAGALMRPDRNNVAPRIGFAWKPLPASTMVVRGGYGVYFDKPQYVSIANQMAQQAPLSSARRLAANSTRRLTLADAFQSPPQALATTFGVDPRFRSGYAHNWQVSLQRDLRLGLQVVATYVGIKGTRSVQQFLPNTFPAGAADPCPACPRGFTYMVSNGNSTRHAGTVQLRRRLRRGFTAEAHYTWAKSIDNAALGGSGFLIAQDWRNLSAERARSNFDQRHAVVVQAQYTTGGGLGGFLAAGPASALLREWTVAAQVNFGTGLPLTPASMMVVSGTGVTGSIRANYTGADPYQAPPGLHLNPAAYAMPGAGEWGNAGRNSITGPSQFSVNASAGRTLRWGDRLNADLRIDASNALNHPVFSAWHTMISSAQFGLPTAAGPMRTIQTSLRVRF